MFLRGFLFAEGGALKFPARAVMVLKRRPGFAARPGKWPMRPLRNRGGLLRTGQRSVTKLQQRQGSTGRVAPALLAASVAGSDFRPSAAAVVLRRHNAVGARPDPIGGCSNAEFLGAATCFVNEQAARLATERGNPEDHLMVAQRSGARAGKPAGKEFAGGKSNLVRPERTSIRRWRGTELSAGYLGQYSPQAEFLGLSPGDIFMNKAKPGSALVHSGELDSPLVDEMNNITSLALSSGSQIAEMQNAVVELVLAECSESYRELLAARDVPVLEQWHNFSYSSVRTNLRLARACWEVATRTQGAMLGAMRECMGPSNSTILAARNTATHVSRERRMQSTVINFPERRRAA